MTLSLWFCATLEDVDIQKYTNRFKIISQVDKVVTFATLVYESDQSVYESDQSPLSISKCCNNYSSY